MAKTILTRDDLASEEVLDLVDSGIIPINFKGKNYAPVDLPNGSKGALYAGKRFKEQRNKNLLLKQFESKESFDNKELFEENFRKMNDSLNKNGRVIFMPLYSNKQKIGYFPVRKSKEKKFEGFQVYNYSSDTTQ